MTVAGIIFSDAHNTRLGSLLNERTLAAIPFAARYRLIDFPLSSMVNADIRNVGIIVKQNYHSLMNHIGSGAPWDLDRKNGGVQILPPFATKDNTDTVYKNRLEGLIANRTFLNDIKDDYIIMTSAAKIGSFDFKGLLDEHIKSGAKISVLYSDDPILSESSGFEREFISCDEEGHVTDGTQAAEKPEGMHYSLETYVVSRKDLLAIVNEAVRENKLSLRRDFFDPMMARGEMHAVKAKTTAVIINTVDDYLTASLALLDAKVRASLFKSENGPVMTKIKDSPPTVYGKDACVENSLISSGANIEGTVKNSIIFRGAHIGKDAVVDHCVVMQNAVISEGVELNYAVLDKNVYVSPGCRLSGYITHPFTAERDERI